MLSEEQRAALAARLRRGKTGPGAGAGPAGGTGGIPRRPADLAEPPMSHGQEQLWFIDRLAPGQATYNIPLALALTGRLDASALTAALGGLTARHEALRTRLAAGPDGAPVQVIDPAEHAKLIPELVDLSGLAAGERRARLRTFIDDQVAVPFDLASDRLLRTWLLRLADDEHILLVVLHHAIFDGWSVKVLTAELAALYQEAVGGAPAGLEPLPVQFADYALWERDRLRGAVLAELEDYWRQTLADCDTLRFPTDRPRPVIEDFAGGLAERLTDRQLLDDLRELSQRQGCTLFVTLLAAAAALLYRYTGQTDVVVGTVTASRDRTQLAPLIGFLVNTLPVRADLSGDPAFTELLDRVRAATIGAYGHQELPFAKLVQALGTDRDPGRAPVFQIMLAYAERDGASVRAAGLDFAITDLVVGIKAAKFDLDFLAEARPDGLWFECSYKSGLFEPETIARLLGHLEVLLRGVVADPQARLSRLPVLTEAERRAELTGFSDVSVPLPLTCIPAGFEAQVTRTPEAVAAEFEGEVASYAELNRWANRIARRLRAASVGPEVLVGVCMGAGLRRIAALLGILKAGGGYVPLDPVLPADRLSFMMTDARMPVVLTDEASAPRVPATGTAMVLSLDEEWARLGELDDSDLGMAELGPGGAARPENVAYVIYTSGSTGRPKGVLVEHRQVANFLHGMIKHWQVDATDRVLQFASLNFDASVQDVFMPLLAGGRIVLVPAETRLSPPRLAALIRDRGVTSICIPPAVLTLLGEQDFPDLRVLMCGGDEVSPELARRWVRPGPGLRFVNDYGPTETTVTSTFMELAPSDVAAPPIGRPMPNYLAYVLDEFLNPVPVGVVGELHIGGPSVTRGYLSRPALTAQRFIADPFTPGGRLYKTGDLVRRRPDGMIVFAGRADGQVKVRGLRIELGEIEAALAGHPSVAQTVVTVVTDPAGDRQLAGYLRAAPGSNLDLGELREHLAGTLPAYMVPTYLTPLAEFPLNSSGKINRSALPPPGPIESAAEHVGPATPTESLVAGLYGEVLHRDQVSVTDSFFDLGGSSLAVMRLVDLIGRQAGIDVGITTVFLHPTARQLAASIDAISSGSAADRADDPIVVLSDGTGDLPLFLIHAVGGTVASYLDLAGELAGTFRVHGLQAPALTSRNADAASPAGEYADLMELADDYTDRIRAAQPAGPYRLAGWSMGGVVAFEVARRLEQAGQQVAMLVLLDAPFAVPADRASSERQLVGQFLSDATRSLGWDDAALPDPVTSTADQQLGWLAARLSDAGQPSDDSEVAAVAAQLARRFEVFQRHARMLAGYEPAPPAISAPTLIVSADDSLNAAAAAQWPAVLGGPVAVLPVASDHYLFLRPPLVMDVATAIMKWEADGAQDAAASGVL